MNTSERKEPKELKGYDLDLLDFTGTVRSLGPIIQKLDPQPFSTPRLLATISDLIVDNQKKIRNNETTEPLRILYFTEKDPTQLHKDLNKFLVTRHAEYLDNIKTRVNAGIKFINAHTTGELYFESVKHAKANKENNTPITLFIFDDLKIATSKQIVDTVIRINDESGVRCFIHDPQDKKATSN